MTGILKFLLASHVLFGLLGVIYSYRVFFGLLREGANYRSLLRKSLWAVVSLVLSWFIGGYYYATYYGKAVRDVIKAGPYPWAHTVFMETKEHIFLIMPFIAVVVTVVLWAQGANLDKNPRLRKELALIAGVNAVLGIIVTLAGALISGAVR